MIFTKEELAILKEADRPLKTYFYGKYVSGCSQATAKKLLTIYRRVTNDTTKICTSCSGGIAVIFKKLAPMYLEALAEVDKPKTKRHGGVGTAIVGGRSPHNPKKRKSNA